MKKLQHKGKTYKFTNKAIYVKRFGGWVLSKMNHREFDRLYSKKVLDLY